MPEFWHANWQEHLVGLCAHELWHLYSRKPSGREQEFECELVESDAIDFYRRRLPRLHDFPDHCVRIIPLTRKETMNNQTSENLP